jgi:hypothetical protein
MRVKTSYNCVTARVVDLDPVGSESFCIIRIGIGIQGFCRYGSGTVYTTTKCKDKLYFFHSKFKFTIQNLENYDADEKDKTTKTGTAVNKSQNFCDISKTYR